MASLLKYYTKGIILNKSLWLWGVFFMVFFIFIGAYEFSQSINTPDAIKGFTSSWYGTITLFSLSSLAISIAYSIYYSSYSLRFSFRFTKLTPRYYLGSIIASSSLLAIFLSVIMLISTSLIFSSKFHISLIPSNPVGAIIVSGLGGIFMMCLSTMLVLFVTNYLELGNINFVSFIPLILSYGFGFALFASALSPEILYSSPFNDIQLLLFQSFSGSPGVIQVNGQEITLEWSYLVLSLALWIIALSAIDIILLRSVKTVEIEEARQV